ncbi:hypothetical protein EV401DRAFT_2005068, partial [Pisolithus croceorrhizus]
MLATLLAIGLDPERSIVFNQDHLCWVLRRMTTWKSRLATSRNAGSEDDVDESLLNSCLFTYPVLQAADVLVYRATHVPHVELTRDLAEILNCAFPSQNSLFPLPLYVN